MVVLGRSLNIDLVSREVKLKVKVLKHAAVLHTRIREHGVDVVFVLQGIFQLLEQFLDSGFVLALPLLLTHLFFCHRLGEHAGKVIFVDHRGQVANNFLLEAGGRGSNDWNRSSGWKCSLGGFQLRCGGLRSTKSRHNCMNSIMLAEKSLTYVY